MNPSQTNGNWDTMDSALSSALGKSIHLKKSSDISGGCINTVSSHHDQNGNKWFIKTNHKHALEMFNAELDGLNEIINSKTIHCPKPIIAGTTSTHSFLILEYLPLRSCQNQTLLARQLAKLHQHQADSFGWFRNNTIGTTPQHNRLNKNWVNFYQTHRLGYQLELAKRNRLNTSTIERGLHLNERLADFFTGYRPAASLLHGDLWGGNVACLNNGQPVIYDPAVYYGDRETDIAMTELFGGFNQNFYNSYNEYYPLDKGYKIRKQLYNLYHILNHFNLFGGGYGSQADKMIQQLFAEAQG